MKERSRASRGDMPDASARKQRRSQQVKWIALSFLVFAVLGTVGRVAVGAARNGAAKAAKVARTEAKRLGAEQDKTRLNEYGLPLLIDARKPGGPTWGKSQWADLDIIGGTDMFFFGPDGHPEDPRTRAYILMHVKNKSEDTWNDVAVDIAMYDDKGAYLRTETYKIGTIVPGQTRRKTCGPQKRGEQGMYSVLGFSGKKAPATPDAGQKTGEE